MQVAAVGFMNPMLIGLNYSMIVSVNGAMQNLTWDYKNPDGSDQGAICRQNQGAVNADPGNYTARRLRLTQLESLGTNFAQNRRFVSPYYWAPQCWGYKVVQLFPETGAGTITVNSAG
jgi:hypothetical protein